MQTYKEKAAILASADSLDDVEVMHPDWERPNDWSKATYWMDRMFIDGYTIRVKPKTLIRTITTPAPVSVDWARANPTALVCGYINLSLRKACEYTDHFIESGLVFHTVEDAEAALKAFTESMK
jgi:hypothetical protein